jgi:hypothetical protein
MHTSDDGPADRLATWVRAMSLEDQLLITSTTLTLEEISLRRGGLPFAIDEVALRELPDPREAALLARSISASYAGLPPSPAPDGVDEYWRISNLTKVIAETIERYHPAREGRA